ncbi:enolase C-terminal domain-like protein [Streptomyces sp. WAC06614]|uniref:enolase C-terminal domain-like protein n=1 Tax=Streptomyces sp. WAC06614 TaxID=2487416 RepID=UPI000F783EB2|nr:enolase C-terminal domain-like protein [Streptomyces sp. WAC06614]RSS72765.1 mandelate racemase [Streptomyces sp. WAC06614]
MSGGPAPAAAPRGGGGPAPVVEALHVRVLDFPTDAPEADGTAAWDSTTMVLVEARAGPERGYGWTYGAAAAAGVVTELLAGEVTGRAAYDVPAAHEAMHRALRDAGRPGIGGYALSAVDIALWDLKARLLGVPLADLFGRARAGVPVYGSGGFTSYDDEQFVGQLRGWTEAERIPRVKIKIGEARGTREDRDLTRIRLARKTVGPDTELYVDADGAYGAQQAVRVAEHFHPFDIRWFEEPVSSDDLAGLARVRAATVADVAAGEYGFALRSFAALVRVVDCLQADATRCGGLTDWLRVAALAQAHGLDLSAHGAPHVHAHAAAASANLRHVEWYHDHVRIEHLLFDGALEATGGELRPGADGTPGLGLTPRKDVLARYGRPAGATSVEPAAPTGP